MNGKQIPFMPRYFYHGSHILKLLGKFSNDNLENILWKRVIFGKFPIKRRLYGKFAWKWGCL
jgi:hypothetical protein